MMSLIWNFTPAMLLVASLMFPILLGISKAAPIDLQKPTACNEQGNPFQHGHIYHYDYTVKTASAFVGASSSVAGSRLTCSVTISVPRQCEHVLKVSGCILSERNTGDEESYTDVQDADELLQDLERYTVYFQLNEGEVIGGSIIADDRETLQVINIKRGIISALQFPVLDRDAYIDVTTKTDVFGSCPIQYNLFDDDSNKIGSQRDVNKCVVPNLHTQHISLALGPSIGQMTGGLVEEPITQVIYPFDTSVTCSHTLGDDNELGAADCLQNHYFRPSAYQGDVLFTAMTNVSQNLKLKNVEMKNLPEPDLTLEGRSPRNIKFDFGVDYVRSSSLTQLQDSLTSLVQKFEESRHSIEVETVPGMFGNFVQFLSSAAQDTLQDLMTEVFDCPEECSNEKVTAQVFFLDGLEACGTDECILTVLSCMNHDHTTKVQNSGFLYSLKMIAHVSDSIVDELHNYCKKSDETLCWLVLGSILSRSSPDDVKEGSTLYKVLESLHEILDSNCKSDTLQHTERKLKTVVKTARNIAYPLNAEFVSKRTDFFDIPTKCKVCMQNSVIPSSVQISMLQFVEDGVDPKTDRELSPMIVDTLFASLRDVTVDSTIRALSFSILMKTTDKERIRKIVKYMKTEDNTDQMKTYMTSAVRKMLQDESPDLKDVTASWKQVKTEDYFYPYFRYLDSYSLLTSKHIGGVSLFKLPLTEMFGVQVEANLIFDPSSKIFSTYRARLNFYHGEKKYKLSELMMRIKGFDLLMDVLLKRINMTPQEMFALYKSLKARAQGEGHDEEQFAKFQQNIVNAVQDLLDEVHHSSELDFDFSVDIALKGKDIAFVSLKELMATIRQIQSTLPPNTSLFQIYLTKLLQTISKSAFKAKEMVNIVRDIPTCAGLPLNMTVTAYGTHIFENSLQSDLLLFMAKKSPTLSGSVSPKAKFLHEAYGIQTVSIGLAHSTGIDGKMLFGAEVGASLKLTYGYKDPIVLAENPTKLKLELELQPITEDQAKDPLRIFYARGRIGLHHYSGVETVQSDPMVEYSHKQCTDETWPTMMFRKLFCVNLVYPDVTTSRKHAYFPLSGPFDLDVTVEDLDSVDLSMYKWTLEYERKKQPGAGYTDHIYMAHDGIFAGEELVEKRYAYMNILYIRDDYSMIFDSALPEFNYTYNANLTNTWRRGMFDFTMADILKRSGLAVAGYVFKVQGRRDEDLREFKFNWNVTTPGLGWDVLFFISTKGNYPDFTERSVEISTSYHCAKDRPLLYMLHLIPTWAAENGDTSKFSVKSSKSKIEGDAKEAVTGIIEFYGRKMKVDVIMEYEGPTTRAHEVFTYTVDGIERTASADYVWTWGQNDAGITLDLSTDLKADNFNVAATGSCSASQTDVTISGDVQYQNTAEENVLNRKKRSVEGVYDKTIQADEATVDKVIQLKNKMFGKSDTGVTIDTDGSADESVLKQFEDADMPEYSIWDLKDWQAKVSLSAKLRPIFPKGVEPGTAAPEGIEADGIWTVEHPWNKHYVQHTEIFTMGKNLKNTFRTFRFWASGTMNTTFTELDGTPVLDGDEQLVITRQGEWHVDRKAGDIFDYSMHFHGPHVDRDYSVLFNWDAYNHDEPLVRVKSDDASLSMPFMNHHYEETLHWAPRHLKHAMFFSHEMITIEVDSEWQDSITQNGSVSLQLAALEKNWSFEFENKIGDGRMECAIVPGSMPDKTLIYSIEIPDRTSLLAKGAIKMEAGADPTPMWTTQVAITGTTVVEITQTWTLAYHEIMASDLRQRMMTRAMMFHAVAEQLRANLNKPLLDQTFIFTSMTPRSIVQQAIMPNFIKGMKFWNRIASNLIPVKYNPESPSEESTISSRFTILLQSMNAAKDAGPDPMTRRLRFLGYLGIKAFSNILATVATSADYTQKIEDVLKQRQYSSSFNTNPFTFDRILDFPEFTDHGKHSARIFQELFGYARHYYKEQNLLDQPSKSVAVIFGRHDSDRVLSVLSFDGSFFELSADKTKECSFLLASDLRQQRWSLVLSPAGVTLLTSSLTVTVGWDKNIYLDNCKQPSAENPIQSSDGTVIVDRKDGTIHVHTTFDLNLEFDTTYDICVVTVDGPYRNETIGLFGTNDKEKYTDFRLKDGQIASDVNQFMADYTLAGTETCTAQTDVQDDQEDENCEEIEKQCISLFQKHYYYTPMYKCLNVRTSLRYNEYCKNRALRCKESGTNFCHALKGYIEMCDKKGLLSTPVTLQGICQSELPVTDMESLSAGSLDIVFIVSQHVDMTEKRDYSVDYVHEVATLDAWDPFEKIRLSVVLFGGTDASPKTVRLYDNGNSIFVDRGDYDWEGLQEVSAITEGGTEDIDAFSAIQQAAAFPFNPAAHKMVVLLMTKKQRTGSAPDLDALKADLQGQGIILNMVSTYKKTASSRISGINWDGQIISNKPGFQGTKSLPTNDYIELLTATKGALWDLNSISEGDDVTTKRMVEEFVAQTQRDDQQFCPAA